MRRKRARNIRVAEEAPSTSGESFTITYLNTLERPIGFTSLQTHVRHGRNVYLLWELSRWWAIGHPPRGYCRKAASTCSEMALRERSSMQEGEAR
jgi:hypothetical protein